MRSSLVLLGALAAAPSLVLASDAAACSPPPPGVNFTIPASSAPSHPANGAIVLSGYNISSATLTATVAGAPAALEPLADSPLSRLGLALKLVPAPAPGDAVVISGNACNNGAGSGSCALSLSFTAGPPDAAAPPEALAVSYDLHDYPDFSSSGGDCQSDSDYALWVTLDGAAEVAPFEYWSVSVHPKGDAKVLQSVLLGRNAETTKKASFRLTKEAADPAKAPLCVTVRVVDVAGNQSAPLETCAPCRARIDPQGGSAGKGGGGSFMLAAGEPAWTAADIVVGGSCDQGGAGGTGGAGPAGAGGTSGGAGATSGGVGGAGVAGTSAAAGATAGGAAGGSTPGAAGAVSGGGGLSAGGAASGGTNNPAGNAGAAGKSSTAGSNGGLSPVSPATDDGGCSVQPASRVPSGGALLALAAVGLGWMRRRPRRALRARRTAGSVRGRKNALGGIRVLVDAAGAGSRAEGGDAK